MTDTLADSANKPDVGELCAELKRSCWDISTRIERIENTRYCRWEGQSMDGRKWAKNLRGEDRKAFPWDGASDTRPFLTDELINSVVDLTSTSFWRAMLRVGPVDMADIDQSSVATGLMHWAIYNRMFNDLVNEVELLGQYTFTYGWAALHVCWQQEMGLKNYKLTAQQIWQMAAQAPEGSVLRELPDLVMNEEATDQVAELMMGVFPHLSKTRATRAVKELRAEGQCEFPIQTVRKNQPSVTALVPFDDICFPPETTDLQGARVVFLRRRLTEVQFRAEGKVNEWPAAWIDKVVETAGRETDNPRVVAAAMTDTLFDRENLIEVVWAYVKAMNEDEVPAVYCTVFSPHLQDEHGSHELLDYGHGDYPFVIFRTETIHRKIAEARGVSEITQTWQQEMKVQRDSIFDYTSINTLPPLQVPKGRAGTITLAPAAQLPVLRPGEISFMDPPAREPRIAFDLITSIEVQADRYFGRPTEKVFPVLTQMRQQRIVSTWLHGWTVAFRQVLALCVQYLTPEDIQRITGNKTVKFDDSTPVFDVSLKFDVRELATDLATEKLEAISKLVLPLDSAGVVDRAKLVKLTLRAIDPAMAEELVMQDDVAKQKMFDETNDDIALMALGNPPKLREMDPAAKGRLDFGRQIIMANPKYRKMLVEDEHFRGLVEKYEQNLQFSVTQQENAVIGRLGVDPKAAEAAG